MTATNAAVLATDEALRIAGGPGFLAGRIERAFRDARGGLINPPIDDVALQGFARRLVETSAPGAALDSPSHSTLRSPAWPWRCPDLPDVHRWAFGRGDWTARWLNVHNPATGELVGRVPAGTEADVDRAVAAARAVVPRRALAKHGRCPSG